MLRQTLFKMSQQEQLRNIATHNGLAQNMARRFVAGVAIEDAMKVVGQINGRGMSATLDHLGENVSTEAEAAAAADSYCDILRTISERGVDCNVSLKLTQFGLDRGHVVAVENLRRVLDTAAQRDTFVRIDMESSDYVDRTLEIFFEMWSTYKNVGVVLQSCLHRTRADLEQVIEAGARVRLVKGAYLEPPSVAYQAKADVDANFLRLAYTLLSRGNYPAIATHDLSIIDATREHARVHGIDRSRYEFQMLYGIRRDLQARLVEEGYSVRIYVPFGVHWYPYMMRRMAERPANLFFVLSNLAREARPGR